MGSRKENLRKSLGITHYPWSSDDEEDGAVDGLTVYRERGRARTQISPHRLAISGGDTPAVEPQSNRVRTMRDVTRRDRDTFWSIINHSRRIPCRRYDMPALTPTITQESRVRSNTSLINTQADQSINNLNSQPSTSTTFSQLNSTTSPSCYNLLNSNPTYAAARISPKTQRIIFRVSNQPRKVNAVSSGTSTEPVANVAVLRKRGSRARPSAPSDATERNLTNSQANPSNIPSDQDIGIVGSAPVTASSANPSMSADSSRHQLPEQLAATNEEHVEASTAGPSTSAIAKNEEIVVIDASDEIDLNGDDRGDIEMEIVGAACPNGNDQPITSANEFDQPQSQGIKRKRESGNANSEPQTVKEFNQILLRMLECPVCLEWMEPPMAQCRRGHLVCSACRGRLTACPVCRTIFSSVRNRAMEGVADMLRYPCRHGCGREVRLRKRGPHEASCAARLYKCPLPACCTGPPLPHSSLALHFQGHASMLKFGNKHKFSLKANSNRHEDWIVMALDEFFYLRLDVDVPRCGIVVYVAYIGPKKKANCFTYQVVVEGRYHSRSSVYTRTTHSDLESMHENMSRLDCFHLTLDQAINFFRFKNRHCEPDQYLDLTLEISKDERVLVLAERLSKASPEESDS